MQWSSVVWGGGAPPLDAGVPHTPRPPSPACPQQIFRPLQSSRWQLLVFGNGSRTPRSWRRCRRTTRLRGEALAEAVGSRELLHEYLDCVAALGSSLSGRWSGRLSQGCRRYSLRRSGGGGGQVGDASHGDIPW